MNACGDTWVSPDGADRGDLVRQGRAVLRELGGRRLEREFCRRVEAVAGGEALVEVLLDCIVLGWEQSTLFPGAGEALEKHR